MPAPGRSPHHRRSRAGRIAGIVLAVASLVAIGPSPARAAEGYEPATPDPVLAEGFEFPHGVAVDQANHRVYVAVVSTHALTQAPGGIYRFESDGTPAGTFGVEPEAFFSGVAVDPITQGFYGSQLYVETPFGNFGAEQLDPFSAAGVMGTPIPLNHAGTLPQIATDSSGNVFVPDGVTDSVLVFDPAGELIDEIDCSGCTGGPFGQPVSVAIDSEDDLYVVDLATDRVVKLASSAGSYGFEAVLQSGRAAAAVGVDPSTDEVFVGDLPANDDYHIVAYDSSGAQFDDFGAGLFSRPALGTIAAGQIAVDATTHTLYVTDKEKVHVFERVVIDPPSATIEEASAISDTSATLNASVDANGHAALDCEFEFTDDGDFQANGFANAVIAPCSPLPDGFGDTAIEAAISGLTPVTIYHFKVTATSNAGSATSLTETFETLPPSPDPDPEPEPDPDPLPAPATAPAPGTAPPSLGPTVGQPLPKCRRGFRRQRVKGVPRCVKICRKSFRRKLVRGKVRCVRLRRRGSR